MAEDLQKRYMIDVDMMLDTDVYVKDQAAVKTYFFQGDTKTALLVISLKEKGNSIDLNNRTARVAFRKVDGTSVLQDGTTGVTVLDADLGRIQVELTPQTLATNGKVRGQVSVVDANGLTAESTEFFFVVRESLANKAVKSSNELPLIEQAISAGKKLTDPIIDNVLKASTDIQQVKTDVGRKAEQTDLNTQKGRIDNLVANAGNTTGNAELQDIRVDAFGKTFANAGDALRALTANNLRKMSDYSTFVMKDNTNGAYNSWVQNTSGYYKTTFDTALVQAKSSLGIFPKVAGTSSELGFVWDNVDDIAMFIRITSPTAQSIGRLINVGGTWGNLQTGQTRIYSTFQPGAWLRVPFTQAELDASKARTDYQTVNTYANLDLTQLTGAGTLEYFVIDNRKNARSSKFYETFSFSSDTAKFADRSAVADSAAWATKAVTSDTAAVLGKIPDKAILGSTGTSKGGTVNTITATQYKSGADIVGYKMDVNNLEYNYAYTYARLTSDKLYNDLKTKKYRIVVKGEQAGVFKVRICNGTSWGSQDNTVGYAFEFLVTLNEANNFTFTYDIDLSAAAFATFYAASQRQTDILQKVYYLLTVNEGSGTELNKAYTLYSYAYELGQKEAISDGMDAKFIKPGFATTEDIDKKISAAGVRAADKIVCWGDSLTAGGGWTTLLSTLSGLPVYNAGTGGENSQTIMARQGGDVMMVNNITIPADTSEILIASKPNNIDTYLGKKVTPLMQGGGTHVNPCYIAGIEGTLRYTGVDYADASGTWVWKRNTAGTAVTIDRPTAIVTNYDKNYNNGIMIIFIGQNGGWNNDPAELVRQHKLMIAHSKASDVVIIGLSTGTASERSAYEAAMKAEFGRYFISLREYMSQYGLADAGLTPTAQDTSDMAVGKMPLTLTTDGTHYTTAAKTVIGNYIYKRMRALNIFK